MTKMRHMRFAAFLLLMMAVTQTARSESGPAVKMLLDDGVIYVLLSNHGERPIKMRTDFLVDSLVGGLSFEIRRGAISLPLAVQININLPTEETYASMPQGSVRGGVFARWFVAHMYGMGTGCYEVSVVYHDKMASEFAAFGGELRDGPLPLCIDVEDSALPLSSSEAKLVAERWAHRQGSGSTQRSVIPAGKAGDFFRFAVQPSDHGTTAIFVARRTAEIWTSDGKHCTRVERDGVPSAYTPHTAPPASCRDASSE